MFVYFWSDKLLDQKKAIRQLNIQLDFLKVIQQQQQQVDNYKMFKPSLKRSNFNQLSTFSSINPNSIRQSIYKDKQFLRQKLESPKVHIPSLLSETSKIKPIFNGPRMISPLNSWNIQYPQQVKQKLNMRIQDVKSRLMGSKYGVFWLVTQNNLYIWRYNSSQNPSELVLQRKYQFQSNLRQVAIGHLDSEECQFINFHQNTQIMAIGFDYIIDLYTINIITLQLRPIDIRFRVQYSQILQKLEITDSNQVLYTGDQGFLSKVSFKNFNKSDARPSLFATQSILPSLLTNKANVKVYTEKILPTQNKIYVLIRKESQGSWLYKFGLSVVKFFSGRIRVDQNTVNIEKQIHVYRVVNKQQGNIKFSGILSNIQIQKNIRQSFSSNEKLQSNYQANIKNTIINIFPYKSIENQQYPNANWISIVTNQGLFINIRQNFVEKSSNVSNFSFEGKPKRYPIELFQPNSKNQCTALFLKGSSKTSLQNLNLDELKQQYLQPLIKPQSKVIFSLGEDNLNFLNNGLCFYFDRKQIQVTKLDKYPGYIIQTEIQPPKSQLNINATWLIFSKQQITVMRKCQYYQYILATIYALKQQQNKARQNKEKKQVIQDYLHNSNESMFQLSQILGVRRLCKELCKLLLYINKLKLNPAQNKGILVKLNKQFIQVTMQEQKINMRIRNCIKKKLQIFALQQNNILFQRWLIPKAKDIKLFDVEIQQNLQLMIWKYFVLYSLQRNESNRKVIVPSSSVPTDPNEKVMELIPPYPTFLIKLFRFYYSAIKDLNITQIRRSPKRIKEIKDYLKALMNLLQQKQIKQKKLLHSFMLLGFNNQSNLKKNQPNKTVDSINNLSTIQTNQARNDYPNNQPYTLLTFRQTEAATQQVCTQICKIIPKILSVLQVYQILAANSQRRYESLPKFHDFLQNSYAKREVKYALLDLFSATDISTQEAIVKLTNSLPELGLSADIYLSKWIKFIHRSVKPEQLSKKSLYNTLNETIPVSYLIKNAQKAPPSDPKQLTKQIGVLESKRPIDNGFSVPQSVTKQIRISNLQQLSKVLQIDQIKKIRSLFADNSHLYMKILINQLEFRKIQLEMVTQIGNNKLQFRQKANFYIKEFHNYSSSQTSIFVADKKKAFMNWKKWIEQQISLIRQQIEFYLKLLAMNLEKSTNDFFHKQKLFDDTSKLIIEKCSQGKQIVKNLIEYIKIQKIIPQKISRLTIAIDPSIKQKKLVSNLLKQQVRIETLDTIGLVNNQIRNLDIRQLEELKGKIKQKKTDKPVIQDQQKYKTLKRKNFGEIQRFKDQQRNI